MRFVLALCLDGAAYYGHIPELPYETCDMAEVFLLEESDWELLNSQFVDSVNGLCGTLLDYGDVDYLEPSQCIQLEEWLKSQLARELNDRTRYLYSKLLDFAARAVEIDTGVMIEL